MSFRIRLMIRCQMSFRIRWSRLSPPLVPPAEPLPEDEDPPAVLAWPPEMDPPTAVGACKPPQAM